MRVISVESDTPIQEVYQLYFNETFDDVELTFFDNGDEALIALRVNLPDIVMTDLRHRGLMGKQFVVAIRSEFPEIPIIVASVFYEAASYFQNMDRTVFLAKPFTFKAFIDAIIESYPSAKNNLKQKYQEKWEN